MRAAVLCTAGALAVLIASPASAVEAVARVATASEQLSNGSQYWRETGAGVQLRFGPRQVLDLAGADVHRFGLHDSQFAASYSLPLSAALTATLDGNASATHRVLARHAAGAALQFEFAPAWLLHGGARTSKYDSGTVNGFQVALERYVSSWSLLLGWRPTRAFGETAHGLEARATYYYGERNAVGLIAAGGDEAASVPRGVVLTDVRSLALTGRHWLDPRWALTWGASYARQGSLYTRKGLNAGVQYVF